MDFTSIPSHRAQVTLVTSHCKYAHTKHLSRRLHTQNTLNNYQEWSNTTQGPTDRSRTSHGHQHLQNQLDMLQFSYHAGTTTDGDHRLRGLQLCVCNTPTTRDGKRAIQPNTQPENVVIHCQHDFNVNT